ncbi:MAG: methylmalonyl-CoA mutase, partial [Oligoflexia bacterium]|nr:methylmalonyl-CoA mutase [Oligoflexia bacterium]
FPPGPSMKLITDIFEFCSAEMPGWNSISVSGYHIREAGATAAQEVGFTLADGIAYIEAARKAGLDIDSFAPRVSFFFNAHNDLFEEAAKFRAARRLWAKIMKQRFNARDPRSMMLRFHAQTAGSALTAVQPDNNIVRVTLQALAAVLGGTQSLHTNSRDEALALPTQESVEIALRTQQIIAEESGVTNTVDPLAGSYFVEHLTDLIEKEAREYINKIDDMGGMIKAIENGYVQHQVQDAAYKYQKDIESRQRIVVGVNEYTGGVKTSHKISKPDPGVEKRQIKRLRQVKANRSQTEVKAGLQKIREAAANGNINMMPFFIEAVSCYCTIGEICDVLREVFGEYREKVII